MRIQTINFIATLFVILFLLFSTWHFWTLFERSDRSEKRIAIANEIVEKTYNLIILGNDIFLHNEAMAKSKWRKQHKEIAEEVQRLDGALTQRQQLIERIKILHKRLEHVFEAFISLKETTRFDTANSYYRAQLSNLFSITSLLNNNALHLQKQSVAEMAAIEKSIKQKIMFGFIMLSILLIGSFFFWWIRIIRPLNTISRKLSSYRSGEYTHRLFWRYDDEVGIFVDAFNAMLDKRVEWEGTLEKINAELMEKNRELDEFTHIVSHDLQAPLRQIYTLSDLLKDDLGTALDENARQDIELISAAVDRMRGLILALLHLSRAGKTALTIDTLSLEQCVSNVLDVVEKDCKERKIQIARDPLPAIEADSTMMTLVFQNLIQNAVNFCDPASPQIHMYV